MSPEQVTPWDPVQCHQYIVDIIGNQERFPERYPYDAGCYALLQRLGERYGEELLRSSSRVLRNFLENPNQGTPEEQVLWREWRSAQAERTVGISSAKCELSIER